MKKATYEVVWPLGRSAYEVLAPGRRLPDLAGKTICELWDEVFRGEEIFPMLRKRLREVYRGVKFVSYEVFGNMHSSGKEKEVVESLPALLRQHGCDAVISGVGA